MKTAMAVDNNSIMRTIVKNTFIKEKAHSIVWPSEKTRIDCISFSVFDNQVVCLSVAAELTK